MKKKLIIIIFLIYSNNVFAYHFEPFGFSIDFPDEVKIDKLTENPFFAGCQDGFYTGYSFKITYRELLLKIFVTAFIHEKIIPVSIESKPILNSYFSNDFSNYKKVIDLHENFYYKRYSPFEEYKKRYLYDLEGYQEDIINSKSDIEISRDLQFDNSMYVQELTYYFEKKYGLYSKYSITIGELFWDIVPVDPPIATFSGDYDETVNLYTFTNEQLENYPDQDNDWIQLMHLLNQAMETLHFDKELSVSQGTVNSNRVRVRSDNNLSSDTLGHVNTGEEVIILDRSENKQQIGEMNDYWYRIISETSYIKGWMYGAFLDLKE